MNGKNTVVILGAGASRGVSYEHLSSLPSPLDGDFFDLLQRLDPRIGDRKAVKNVLEAVSGLSREYWGSFEQAFYTLQMRAYLSRKLKVGGSFDSDSTVVTNFALCVHALLREAHGKKSKCRYHESILTALGPSDSILTFNYDLVAERAMKLRAESQSIRFEPSLYGLVGSGRVRKLPLLLKLHGSSNWRLRTASPTHPDKHFQVLTKDWKDFDKAPGYMRISKRKTTAFPIFLPFWEKRIEHMPWVALWRTALRRLQMAENVMVWGYSMPSTDVKAYVLFTMGLADRPINLCVIDPSPETCKKWRTLFSHAKYWEYKSAREFLRSGPPWFLSPPP